MRSAYNAALIAAVVLGVPLWGPALLLRSRYREGLGQRLARYGPELKAIRTAGGVLWVHAASVGEVRAVMPLLERLRTRAAECPLVLSVTTPTGHRLARSLLDGPVCYLPLDLPWIVRRAVRELRPRLLLLAETELWPNLLAALHARGCPVALVNGRISPRAFPRYRLIRPLVSQALGAVALCCMQSEADAERIRALGADPARVVVTGNLKFDQPLPALVGASLSELTPLIGAKPVVVAGSTHAGEEAALLEACAALRARFPELVLVLAPRHPGRFDEVAALVTRSGEPWIRRSHLRGAINPPHPAVVLLDSVGELPQAYALATVVFVGGSLVPVGGHNVLEPAAWGKPVLFGPSMENFQEIGMLMVQAGGGIQVSDRLALATTLERLLSSPQEAAMAGERGRALLEQHRGAVARTCGVIEPLLGQAVTA